MSARRRKVLLACALLAAVASVAFAMGRFVIWDLMLKPECVYGDVASGTGRAFWTQVGIDIRAVDAQEGTPVRGASIELWWGVPSRGSPRHNLIEGNLLASSLTGPAGEATVGAVFPGVTRGDRYGQSNLVSFNLHTLVVRAEGYVTVQTPLEQHTGRMRLDQSSDRLRLDIKLNRPTRSQPP
jgi:hypothetical protein